LLATAIASPGGLSIVGKSLVVKKGLERSRKRWRDLRIGDVLYLEWLSEVL